MCGRFVATTAPQQLASLFDAVLDNAPDAVTTESFSPNYNVAPTTQILHLTTRQDGGEEQRVLQRAHWGLLPSWSKDRSRAASIDHAGRATSVFRPRRQEAPVRTTQRPPAILHRHGEDLRRRSDVVVRSESIGERVFENRVEQQCELLRCGGGNESPTHRRAGEI